MVRSCRLILEIGILRTSKRKGQIRVKKGAKKRTDRFQSRRKDGPHFHVRRCDAILICYVRKLLWPAMYTGTYYPVCQYGDSSAKSFGVTMVCFNTAGWWMVDG